MQPKNDASDFTLILKHGKEMRVRRNEIAASSDFFSTLPVSYTHLTLPTIYSV